jgi:hypothetical protein
LTKCVLLQHDGTLHGSCAPAPVKITHEYPRLATCLKSKQYTAVNKWFLNQNTGSPAAHSHIAFAQKMTLT